MGFIDFLGDNLVQFWEYTGFANCTLPHLAMILVGLFFIYLAIKKNFEPMLLVPIGFGILIGNIPFKIDAGLEVGIYEEGSVLNILYQGVSAGWYPPLVFLGIGAMTDFSSLIANPKLMLVGAAAQFGIFGAYMVALATSAISITFSSLMVRMYARLLWLLVLLPIKLVQSPLSVEPMVLRLYSFHRNWRRILWGPLRFRHILIWP